MQRYYAHATAVLKGRTMNSDLYCQKLLCVRDALNLKRRELNNIGFQHYNARPHIATITQQLTSQLG